MKRVYFIFFACLIFYSAEANPPGNDDAINAYDLTDSVSNHNGYYCSLSDNVTYTTTGATADGVKPSCMVSSHMLSNNVWFKYEVGESKAFDIKFNLLPRADRTRHPYVTLWQDSDTTDNVLTLEEISCRQYSSADNAIHGGANNLNEGQYYYVSIDVPTNDAIYTGVFDICVSDESWGDDPMSAFDLTQKVEDNGGYYCSATDSTLNYQFSTAEATADGPRPSCQTASTHPVSNNMWFKYEVGESKAFDIKFNLLPRADRTRYPYVTLWQDSDTTDNVLTLEEISCRQYSSADNAIHGGANNLNEGQYYYVSIDVPTSSYVYTGVFDICVSDEAYPDDPKSAFDLTAKVAVNGGNYCSQDAEFENVSATNDGPILNCTNLNINNLWFKYVAEGNGTVSFTSSSGGSKGTLRYVRIAAWEDNNGMLTQITCKSHTAAYESLSISDLVVEQGKKYLFSVGTYDVTYSGSLSICFETDVTIAEIGLSDLCFELNTLDCNNLIADEASGNTIIKVPISVGGNENTIPQGFEMCIGFDDDLVPSTIPIVGGNSLNFGTDYTAEITDEEICIKFISEYTIPISREIGSLELIVDYEGISAFSSLNLEPFRVSFPCGKPCSECIGEPNITHRALSFYLAKVYESETIDDDGTIEYSLEYLSGNTEILEKVNIQIGTASGTNSSYGTIGEEVDEFITIDQTFNHEFYNPNDVNTYPSLDQYYLKFTGIAKSGMSFKFEGYIPRSNGVVYGFYILPLSLGSNDCNNPNNVWPVVYAENPNATNISFMAEVKSIETQLFILDGQLNSTDSPMPPANSQDGRNLYYNPKSLSIEEIGNYKVKAIATETESEFNLEYDYIIECGKP